MSQTTDLQSLPTPSPQPDLQSAAAGASIFSRGVDTPYMSLGSILRIQKRAMLAFYMGQEEDAHRDLVQVARQACEVRLVDHQTFMVLAVTSFRGRKSDDLGMCLSLAQAALQEQPQNQRLERVRSLVQALAHYDAGQLEKGWAAVDSAAAGRLSPAFDFEAACNLVMTVASLASRGHRVPRASAILTDLGMRFLGADTVLDTMTRAAWVHPEYAEVLRSAHAKVLAIASEAIELSIKGDPTAAVERLMKQGHLIQNVKLLESARRTLGRHRERIMCAEILDERLSRLHRLITPVSAAQPAADSSLLPSIMVRMHRALLAGPGLAGASIASGIGDPAHA